MTITSDAPTETAQDTAPYTIVSCDTHIGPRLNEELRPYCPPELLDEFDAPAEDRAIGEATIARVIAERGDTERARAIALSARSRLGGDPPAGNHGTRIVLGELARLERAAGDFDAAGRLYAEALDLPDVDLDLDTDLVEELTQELAALNEGERADVIPADSGATIEPNPWTIHLLHE